MAASDPSNDTSIVAQLRELQSLTVAELRARWLGLYGTPSRSRNKPFLLRRLAWRLQELQSDGLSARALLRLKELQGSADLSDLHVRIPNGFAAGGVGATTTGTRRDPRLPAPGTVLRRTYRGQEIQVTVHAEHFEWNGASFSSLSALAQAITGQHWNGRLFFGLSKRSRKE